MLNAQNILEIHELAKTIRQKLDKKQTDQIKGAYDIELGFQNDKLWLFQIRPFVENKKALGSDYLKSITPSVNNNKTILLSTSL